MKVLWIGIVLLLLSLSVHTNEYSVRSFNRENKLVIITLDGLRWQEIFDGADSSLINNPHFNADVSNTKALYWASTGEERRKKLMPFFWNILSQQGRLYGNRHYRNNMNVANPYALSYPGYSELLTGHVDLSIFNNDKAPNQNLSLLEMLAASATYKNKVAAFTSWDAFPYILNKEKSSVFINSGFENLQGQNLSATEASLNTIQTEIEDKKNTRYDELTYIACKEYIQKKKPLVLFLGLGGTDEAAHQKSYDQYLQQASNADRMIGDLWQYLQTLPEYAAKTTFLITTDHGRGSSSSNWHKHGMLVDGSSQTWMGLLGHSVSADGEMKNKQQLYQKDLKEFMLKTLAYSLPQ
ncbi:MAG TPA: alkaline phosphatase family protein [Flavisolibacter sp.]|jgi:hypothetical protein|nr:alkaline phosphatase family protein [Flavisolibacter sp.]